MTEIEKLLDEYSVGETAEEPRKTIMFVDDEAVARESYAALFSDYTVILAEGGREALEKVNAGMSCIVMDAKMPGMDGFEVSRRIQEKFPNIPIIMHTAFHGEHRTSDVVSHHFFGYVEKGSDPENLKLQVRNAVELYSKRLKVEEYQRDLERKVEEQTRARIQAEKMAGIGRLAAGLAHEINNPATSLQRSAEQMQLALAELKRSCSALRCEDLERRIVDIVTYLSEKLGVHSGELVKSLEAILLGDIHYASVVNLGEEVYREGLKEPMASTTELRERALELEAMLQDTLPDAHTVARQLCKMGLNKAIVALLMKSQEHFPHYVHYLNSWYDIGAIIRGNAIGAERIAAITNGLKEYSRLDKTPQDEVNIEDTLEQTLLLLHNELKEGIRVHREYCGVKPISCYPSQLAQVWTNIIHNAVQAMEGKGDLTIQTYENASSVGVGITDTGKGIPQELQNKIFEMFFTTKEPGEGTGLGLSTCFDIVQKHRGTIEFTSRPGKTTFDVRIPRSRREAAKQALLAKLESHLEAP